MEDGSFEPIKEEKKDLIIEIKKEELKEAIESGLLNPQQQYAMIKNILYELYIYRKLDAATVEMFRSNEKRLLDEIRQKEEQYISFYKKYYDRILAL